METLPTLYLETSAIRRYFDPVDAYRREATRSFWKEKLPRYKAYVSDVVLEELVVRDEKLCSDLRDLVADIEPLPRSVDADALADFYMQNKIVPKKARNDALHVAIATLHNLDFLVTWNLNHIANSTARAAIKTLNTSRGYKYVEIRTPLDLE